MSNLERLQTALTSTYWAFTYWKSEECPPSLLQALMKEFPKVTTQEWAQRVMLGGTYVNGKVTQEDCALQAPCRIEYFEPKFDLQDPHKTFPAFNVNWIIFEDEDLLVCYKPMGLSCLPTRDQKVFNLRTYLENYLKSSTQTLHMPSRLDTSVKGIVVTSKSLRMHPKLQRIFEHRRIKKRYAIEVSGTPEWKEHAVDKQIARDYDHPILRKTVEQGGKTATTNFSFVKSSKHDGSATSILYAQPITGRTHQIRVHAQSMGYPIVGDNFYGGSVAPELHMLSYDVLFNHPFRQEELHFKVPSQFLPEWFG